MDSHIQNMKQYMIKSFEDFRAYNKEGKDGLIDLIGKSNENDMEGTGGTHTEPLCLFMSENPIQNDINLQRRR